ncbi:MAG TPA: hypothetical protein VK213_14295 [Bacteroidales bacterium]|nr:hypothetical protein [Bacteroidales bacterium]
MDYRETKNLFNFLDTNRKHFTPLQLEFIESLKKQYKVTGLLTSVQAESLLTLKDKVNSFELIPDEEFMSGLYSQLQDTYF